MLVLALETSANFEDEHDQEEEETPRCSRMRRARKRARMTKLKRQHHRSLLAITAGWALAVMALYWGSEWLFTKLKIPYLAWEYAMQDWVANQARPAEPSPEIFFLAEDAPSHTLDLLWPEEIEASPTLPLMKHKCWSREIYAAVLNRLAEAGAKVVAFDLMFPREDAGDRVFHDALEKYRSVAVIGSSVEETGISRSLEPPNRALIPSSSRDDDRVGFVNVWPDQDDVVRRMRLHITSSELSNISTDEAQEVFESLAARVARKAGYASRIPTDHLARLFRYAYRGETLLNTQKPPSLYQIFVPTFWEKNYANGAFFKDKIVLVGPEGRFNKDIGKSPFGDVAGPEFHMNTVNAIINGEFLRQTALGADLLLIALGGVIAWVLGRFVPSPTTRILLVVAGAVAWFFVSVKLYDGSWVVPVLSPILALTGSGFLYSIVEQLLDRREKAKLRKTFERYVSKDVVKELVDNPEGWLNTLGGRRKPITILFSDVRGFTTLTESADPHALVAQLNEYFDDMVEIVFANNGTLDKFIGDAVMAHWGSIRTEGVEADARRAVATAVQMRKTLARVNPEWKARGMLQLQFGIGVNHGEAIVGNLGSKEKAEVSVISDAVNLASRLEGVTKQYHIDLCIGETVAPFVRDAFILRSLDLILVKGKTKPVEIFAVLDERGPGVAEPAWLPRHEEAVKLYRAGGFLAAAAAWREVLAQCPGDNIAEVFIARCDELRANPPADKWDGVFEMKSK